MSWVLHGHSHSYVGTDPYNENNHNTFRNGYLYKNLETFFLNKIYLFFCKIGVLVNIVYVQPMIKNKHVIVF